MPQQALPAPPGPVSLVHRGVSGLLKKAKVVAHYGFVPFVLYLGFQSDPDRTFLQLFLPI